MACINESDHGVGQILLERLSTRRDKENVVLAPDSGQWHLRLSEVFVEVAVEADVVLIIHEQIKLDLLVTGPLQQRIVQIVRCRSNQFDAWSSILILELGDLKVENSLRQLRSVF